jgi:DNA adenine methylase
LFWILQKYPNIKKAVINDINTDLINTYLIIKKNVEDLISILKKWEKEYHSLKDKQVEKKEYYYSKITLFNNKNSDKITQAALFIFLNRTCFNGLYRVNRKNEFNVPIGSYKTPMICDEDNLKAVSNFLQKVTILNGDFEDTLKYADENTLFYFDPPYKPLSETSNFNSYVKEEFDDNEQIRLAKFCEKIDLLGYQWILSNSDVKGKNPDDNFFDNLYGNFNIKRVLARRNINSNPNKRGKLTELLITNYDYEKIMSVAQ